MWDVEAVRSRLAELRAWDRRRSRLVGAGTHRYRLRRPMTERDVTAFERRHNVVLSEAYRAFLRTVRRGGAGPGCGVYEFDGRTMRSNLRDVEADVPGFLSAPFPHVSEWNEYRDEDSYRPPRWVAGFLPIDPGWQLAWAAWRASTAG